MFYETFARLCQQKGVSPNAVAKEIGVKSTGTVSAWKKGAIPNDGKLLAIAEYFGVTVDYLLGIDAASYADNTKYNLSKLETEYAAEKDPDRKAELSGQIDILKESLADQAIASAFAKPVEKSEDISSLPAGIRRIARNGKGLSSDEWERANEILKLAFPGKYTDE